MLYLKMAWKSSDKLAKFGLLWLKRRDMNKCHLLTVNLRAVCLSTPTRSASSGQGKDVTEGLQVLSSAEKEEEINSIQKRYNLHIESRDKRGWTCLMHAAKVGNDLLIQTLLHKGASPSKRCKNDHTAADIAQFWQNRSSFDILESAESAQEYKKSEEEEEHFFGGSLLDRAAHLRSDDRLLGYFMDKPDTQFILLHKLSPLVKHMGKQPALFKATHETIKELSRLSPRTSLHKNQTAFMGFQNYSSHSEVTASTAVNESMAQAVFCVDISEVDEQLLDKVEPEVNVVSHPLALLALSKDDAALCSQAKALLHWHRSHQYCPCCGSKTESTRGGYKRNCSNEGCYSRKGVHNYSYPRVDPSIISLVISPDKLQCLLARGHQLPEGVYTCLAGFVEPGESVSMACRREVKEEVGLDLGHIDIHTTQPWPSPSVLMIGCTAQAKSTQLKVDEGELEDADWFSRSMVVDMITKMNEKRFFIPPTQALAYHLVKSWLKQTAFM